MKKKKKLKEHPKKKFVPLLCRLIKIKGKISLQSQIGTDWKTAIQFVDKSVAMEHVKDIKKQGHIVKIKL